MLKFLSAKQLVEVSDTHLSSRLARRGATSTVYFVLPSYVMIFVFGRISILDFFFLKTSSFERSLYWIPYFQGTQFDD